ncbi:MAG: ribonuclease III family protein [Chloroflexota bacterium]
MEQRLGCHFANSQLLLQSLAHRSYLNENPNFRLGSNERLEFLGDAVLAYVCAEYLYQRFPTLQEGELTALRAAAVKADTLAKFANQLQLGQYLLLGRGEAKGGGRTRPLLLSSGFEAVIGALLLDAGLPPAR